MELRKAHIFEAGNWNGHEITTDVLDSLAESFVALALDGRVPLKLGHDDSQPITDGQPAVGWVTKLWREGSSLYATFSGLPAVIYDSIRKGLYKYTSVEILRDVPRGDAAGTVWPAVLDAVALLGAAKPAVANLAELSKLIAARAERPMQCEAVQMFSTAFAASDDDEDEEPSPQPKPRPKSQPAHDSTADVVRLTAERDDFARKVATEKDRADAVEQKFAALTRRVEDENFDLRANALVYQGRITPAQRDNFAAERRDPALRQLFTADRLEMMALPAGQRHGFGPREVHAKLRTIQGEDPDSPVAELRAARLAFTAQAEARGERVDSFTAGIASAKARPDLMGVMFQQLFRARPNGR